MILTSAVFFTIVLIELIGLKYKKDIGSNFFDLKTANVLRGVCSIIVIMVHIPAHYTNKVQDMIGSFAFVGVTLFFMMSAYGLVVSVKTKENYLKGFFRKRISVILIPLLISVAVKLIFGLNWRSGGVMFIAVLLLFYVLFWMVNRFVKWQHKNSIIVLFVVFYSLFGYLFVKDSVLQDFGFSWYYEAMGFAYGILFAQFQDKFAAFAKNKYFLKLSMFALCSGLSGVLYLKFKTVYFWGEYLLKCMLGIAITALVIMIVTHFRLGNRLSVELGKISFEIFLYHGFVISLLNKYTHFSSGVFIFLTVVLTITLAFVMNRLDSIIVKRLKN